MITQKMRNLNPAFYNHSQVKYIVFKMMLDSSGSSSTFMKVAY